MSKNIDRLTYAPDGKTLDEVVIYNCTLHLEQLDDQSFMLIGDNGKHRWHLRINSRNKRSYVDAWLYDDESPVREVKHE